MQKFKIIPLSQKYAEQIRNTHKDDLGHDIIELLATGKGPCRVSLKPFKIGEDYRLLLSYSPFLIDNAFNQNGPIFINKESVEEYTNIHKFPPEIKADKQSFPITLIGYSSNQTMIFTRLVGNDDIDLLIPQIFEEHPLIEYLHARNAEAGCYICKIERT